MNYIYLTISGRCWRFPDAKIDRDSWEGELRSDGTMLLRDDTGAVIEGIEVDDPEVFAVAPLPSVAERRRREVMLARLLALTLETLLSEGHTDLAVKIETARDVIREFKFVYPETMNV